jgi:SAM-dependent methyltransferase
LNLGLWENSLGDPLEAEEACIRLVRTMAEVLPEGGDILDVANGLGAQDPVIARAVHPRTLTALNITESQLRAGKERLAAAGARPVRGDAVRLPIRDGSMDGVISVEAAFHFLSRSAFFEEAFRVLRPGGVLSMSDVPTQRSPRTPSELIAGLGQLRLWGLRASSVASSFDIGRAVERAGFTDVRMELCGDLAIDPAVRFARRRLPNTRNALSLSQRVAVGVLLRHVELLRRKGMLEYMLLSARKP